VQILDDRTIVAASDLNNYLACRHLLSMNLAKAMGELKEVKPSANETADLLSRKGDEHEDAYLEGLRAGGLTIAEIPFPEDSTIAALERTAALTLEALRAGPDVVFQATFFDGVNRGHADFLFRVDRASDLGDLSYEVADTKLAKHSKPYFLIQLCFYSELLEKVQGGGVPENVHVILGTGEKESFRLSEFSAYYRRVRKSFEAELEAGVPDTYPLPVSHCEICSWKDNCEAVWDKDDHLTRVAGIQRRQIELLEADGVTTLAELGMMSADRQVSGVRSETLSKIRTQAALQLEDRESGENIYRLLPPRSERGFSRLPEPSHGDIFFDFEGDPLFGDRGLEYLFGYVAVDSGKPLFTDLWGRNYEEEKLTFETFIDFVMERRKVFPGSHVYHYAPYEVTAIRRLAGVHATRELEVDKLLRDKVFVDLYKIVSEGLQISKDSYSIKKVESFYRGARDTEVADGGASIVEFEKWLETGDDSILKAIADYNEDDCVSTLECRDWLLERRAEATNEFDHEFPWFDPEPGQVSEEAEAQYEENAGLRDALTKDFSPDRAEWSDDQRSRWLLAQLVDYHQREARPVWWQYFDRLDASDDEVFVNDLDCIGGLELDETVPPRPDKRSMVYRMRYPLQETKMRPGSATDASTGASLGSPIEVNTTEGWLDLKRGPKFGDMPFPRNLIPGGPIQTNKQRAALRRLASSIIELGLDSRQELTAGRDMLRSLFPRIYEHQDGTSIVRDATDLEELSGVVARLEDSYLFVQGPPGAGKTFSAGRIICDLVKAGKTIGVTSNSHKAVNNLLHGIEEAAEEEGIQFRGLKVGGGDNAFVSGLKQPLIETGDGKEANEFQVTGGTAWHYCGDDVDTVDYLFVDEAGQVSFADALALSTAARNVILFGDPQQLPQVTQARHPDGAGVSILEHLLGDHQTIPEDRGVFLDKTWRLAPEIASFISEMAYEGRLESAPGRENQKVQADGKLSGAGVRWMPVESDGRSQSSPEEAAAVAAAITGLLDSGASYTDHAGTVHPISKDDILVVSPYNAHVSTLLEAIPDGVRVGTVDKFQGQEAQVVFFSMATSSEEEMPRNIEFLFSLNRLNVAISRAKCLAVLVANPRLFEVDARTIDQMRLVNSPCRLIESSNQIA